MKWIVEKRDACKDLQCLKSVYVQRIGELSKQEAVSSASESKEQVKYFRYLNNQKDEHTTIEFKKNINGMVSLGGISVSSNGRIAEFSGDAKVIKNTINFKDGDCSFKIERKVGENFMLKEDSGSSCGGLGVSFDGEYRNN